MAEFLIQRLSPFKVNKGVAMKGEGGGSGVMTIIIYPRASMIKVSIHQIFFFFVFEIFL